jgi:hypothetical protein
MTRRLVSRLAAEPSGERPAVSGDHSALLRPLTEHASAGGIGCGIVMQNMSPYYYRANWSASGLRQSPMPSSAP